MSAEAVKELLLLLPLPLPLPLLLLLVRGDSAYASTRCEGSQGLVRSLQGTPGDSKGGLRYAKQHLNPRQVAGRLTDGRVCFGRVEPQWLRCDRLGGRRQQSLSRIAGYGAQRRVVPRGEDSDSDLN